MEIFKGNYVRLDDDVSFQILRTNPKLTTNTKLMYDGENLFMEAYPAAPILSTMEYKHHRVWKTGLFNRDIRNFLLGTGSTSHIVGQDVEDTIMPDNFDNQFETMYWCGVEAINSDRYPQEMGCVAPLYLRKKRPNYFVIFKIDDPSNTVMQSDLNYDFLQDVKYKAHIHKAFDLREGTPIGDYIKRYVEQRDFKYDQSIYVNFSSNEIYYYGIDKKSGVLTQKVENFQEQLLRNDNTIMRIDDWITTGFERNNLIFPYIINFEFLFDDKESDEFKFARYFGMYCNDIDLYDYAVNGCYEISKGHYTVTGNWNVEDPIVIDGNSSYYIKDKYRNIYTIKNTQLYGHYNVFGKLDVDNFTGFEPSSTTAYAERLSGVGYAFMVLSIEHPLSEYDEVRIQNTIYNEETHTDTVQRLGTFIATKQYDPAEFFRNKFSCTGTLEDTAKALAGVIRTCDTDEFKWITAFNIGNKVVIKAAYPGSNMNNLFNVTVFDVGEVPSEKISAVGPGGIIEKDSIPEFKGGTDVSGCLFKIYSEDKDMFFDTSGDDRDPIRYLKSGVGRTNSEVTAIMPYINENNEIDETYSLLVTDYYGQYVNVSKTNQIEIIDKFYAKIGILSFFPVKDFDFDTISSAYGEYSLMQNELNKIDKEFGDNKESESGIYATSKVLENLPYGRFFYENGDKLDTEYEYFFENIVPEMTTVSKSAPFITKWGYMDEGKDSCENPYRLNTSKIFETCNFSANTFVQKGSIMEYTHSMPYYINNYGNENKDEYQYVYPTNNGLFGGNNLDSMIEVWENYFTDTTVNNFDKMFGDASTTIYGSKRFNKKYSRFLLGNDVNKSSTLFRGVKFEITELENGKEVKSGKYNDYKFSFVYVPVPNIELDKFTVHFIKNDTFKFIVGFVFFNMMTNDSSRQLTKGYVYAASMGFLDISNERNVSITGILSQFDPEGEENPEITGQIINE